VPFSLELQMNAVMDESFAIHPVADAERAEQVDGSLLQHARAQSSLDVRAITPLDDHGVDPVMVQQMPQREPRRSGPDDRDLCAGRLVSRHAGGAWRADHLIVDCKLDVESRRGGPYCQNWMRSTTTATRHMSEPRLG